MRKISILSFLALASIFLANCKSGLVTTSNSCYNLIKSSDDQNSAGDYSDALSNFNQILEKCDSYDAKVPAYAGKATALNGLHQYNDALSAANEGLKLDKNCLNCLFAKADAEIGLGKQTEAKTDLENIVALTSKNKNITQRASIYAKIAALESRQQHYADAQTTIQQAISLDPDNTDFYILRGDIYSSAKDYNAAIESYNTALAKGKNDGAAYKGKVEALIKMYQAKYGTNDVNVLATKMNVSEKNNVCESIKSGLAQGMKNMNIELAQVAICK